MKKIISYITLCAVLLGSACTKDEALQGEGVVSFRISMGTTRSYNPLENMLIRIYNADGGLIRRYKSFDEMPDNLYLVAGQYKIVVDAGDKSAATWTNKSYHGEKVFTVEANKAITERIPCPSINVGAEVVFGPTIGEKLDKGAYAYICASDGFLLTEINEVPTLKFDVANEVATGYFVLPEGVSNLSWGFYGEGSVLGTIQQTGVIENVEAAMIYKLRFQYSKTPDGFASITVLVDKRVEEYQDNIIFSPQPTIKGDGFAAGEPVGFNNNNICFNVASVKKLSQVNLTAGDQTYTIFNLEATTPTAGLSYEVIDDNNVRVIVGPEFLSQFETGVHSLLFNVSDTDNGEGSGVFSVAMPGLLNVEAKDIDLWYNTGVLKAIVTDPNVSDVKIAYRPVGEAEWNEMTPTKSDGYFYTASIAPSWIEGTNSKDKAIYTMKEGTGLRARVSYEYCVMLDGVKGETKPIAAANGDVITTLNNSGLSCYTTGNESDNNVWGSGNNGTTGGLCSYDAGIQGARLAGVSNTATSIVGMFAPGNLFMGTFKQSGMNGTASFGNKYTYTARPAALKLRYKASIGTVDVNKHGGPLATGQPDKARIFVAIIDWGARHGVVSGVGAPSGMWDPENGINAVSEGTVIGCGSTLIEGKIDDMTELTLPINYFNTTAKPTAGRYSLVISCATSTYGDYINGCKSNTLHVADFEWIY